MVRSLNANVIVPLVLAFAIGVLVYLYGTTKSQLKSAEEELKEIRKDLADARSEKESLRYELDTLTDELEQLSKDKKEALQRAEAAEEHAHKANNDLVWKTNVIKLYHTQLAIKSHLVNENTSYNQDTMPRPSYTEIYAILPE